MINRRTKRIAAIAVGLALVAAACGDDDDSGGGSATSSEEAPATDGGQHPREASAESSSAPATTEARGPGDTRQAAATTEPAEAAAMTVTYTLSDAAVWSDGSPMSCGRLRVHVAGLRQHARVDHHHRLRPDHLGHGRRHRQGSRRQLRSAVRRLEDAVRQPILKAVGVRRLQRRDQRLQRRATRTGNNVLHR